MSTVDMLGATACAFAAIAIVAAAWLAIDIIRPRAPRPAYSPRHRRR